jgi:glycosyltransferase involved in cell wall biosynthesis
LQKILNKFDIGINWVDEKNYSDSPSLKFLEYLQSGLKVVSSKNSVNENYFQKGIDFLEFDNDERDLSEKILEINKLKINNIRNHKIINDSFSFNKIYKEYLFPKIYKKNHSNKI